MMIMIMIMIVMMIMMIMTSMIMMVMMVMMIDGQLHLSEMPMLTIVTVNTMSIRLRI